MVRIKVRLELGTYMLKALRHNVSDPLIEVCTSCIVARTKVQLELGTHMLKAVRHDVFIP